MPSANMKIPRESVTTEQKAELIRGVTELLRDKLGKGTLHGQPDSGTEWTLTGTPSTAGG
jgi:hypothetical protein